MLVLLPLYLPCFEWLGKQFSDEGMRGLVGGLNVGAFLAPVLLWALSPLYWIDRGLRAAACPACGRSITLLRRNQRVLGQRSVATVMRLVFEPPQPDYLNERWPRDRFMPLFRSETVVVEKDSDGSAFLQNRRARPDAQHALASNAGRPRRRFRRYRCRTAPAFARHPQRQAERFSRWRRPSRFSRNRRRRRSGSVVCARSALVRQARRAAHADVGRYPRPLSWRRSRIGSGLRLSPRHSTIPKTCALVCRR